MYGSIVGGGRGAASLELVLGLVLGLELESLMMKYPVPSSKSPHGHHHPVVSLAPITPLSKALQLSDDMAFGEAVAHFMECAVWAAGEGGGTTSELWVSL